MSDAGIAAGSTGGEGLRVLANLWQNYGGVYGDYCVLINIATILLLIILRSSNWLPSLQSSVSSWLLSSAKLEWDGLALWQTGSMATHHQYLVVFCVFGAARRRLQLTDVGQACTDKAGWFASLERILSRARSYTLLVVIISQYNAVSTCCLIAGMGMLVVSRAYEVYYPWLVSIHSQQTCLEQTRKAMMYLQRNVQLLDDSGFNTGVPWPVPSFCNTTHIRLAAFRAHISSNYGLFMPCNLQAHSARGSSSLDYPRFYCGWVDGSCLMSSFSLLLALIMCWELSTSQTSPLTWRLAGGLLHLLCFCSMFFRSIPAFIYRLSKLAETLINSCENDRLIIYSQEWWSETKGFLGVLVTHGLPSQEQLSVLGSRSGACFSNVVGRLEGLEFAVYVLLAAFMKLFTEALLCRAVLLLKRLGLGHKFLLLCQRMESQILTRLVIVRAIFPGLINSVAITILKAETALASQKICLRSGLCVQALHLEPGLFTRLETVVQHKGAIEEPCRFFLHTRAESSHLASELSLEDPFLARAVALGLLEQAECCLRKLQGTLRPMRHVVGASFMQELLWLVRVYAVDSYVSNVETRDAMLRASQVVREVVQEALEAHWQHYKTRERTVEANFCGCVGEEEWSIMTAQASVELLLVYMGLRISSLEWPCPQQEARVLKDWIATRSTIITGEAKVLLVD